MDNPLKIAVVVSVFNEAPFLPDFIGHYEREADRIFVFDNESDDGSTDVLLGNPKVEIQTYSTGGKFDDRKKHHTVAQKRRDLAGLYDYVLLVDADELVVPKEKMSIREMIEKTGRQEVYGTEGWNIYTYPDSSPYDPLNPILKQRRRGVTNDHYSKPIISRPEVNLDYCHGCHFITNRLDPAFKTPEGTQFWLFHLRGFDDEIFIHRSMEKVSRMLEWPGHYYWNATEDDMRKRIAYEKIATTVREVVPDWIYR